MLKKERGRHFPLCKLVLSLFVDRKVFFEIATIVNIIVYIVSVDG